MKKNKDKEKCSRHSVDKLLKKRATDIQVFLIMAVFIFAASFFPSHRQFFQKSYTPASTETTEKYVWLTGSTEIHEGLYLFAPEQLKSSFPGVNGVLNGEGVHLMPSMVYAIQYNGHQAQPVKLPPSLANIFFQPIPINRADKNILTSLPGIGPVLAEKIVQRRNQHGPFRSKAELLQIAGIGPKKYEALFDHIILD